ncbi:hypothetical protein L596_022107 [Steinernema carpocapsae]|uniref:Uncharacterized protein n=1 Tax=Steinernema carpocapsae TaxID=34508 RepID=A0A4U5MKR2_STECR|nr:hypothetical protein L596_022107 [Steinernema carpocapsae]
MEDQAAKQPENPSKTPTRNPQTAQKLSYSARIAEVAVSSATALSIQMMSPGDSRRRVFKLVAVAVSLNTLSRSLSRMSLKVV